jgi:hypothetical protein
MKKSHTIILLIAYFTFTGCGDKNSSAFPMEKKYWTPDDYETVNEELTAAKNNNKELPNLDNPKTVAIFQKIADTINFSIVANDTQLGLQHRKEFLNKFFDEYKQLVEAYSGTDRTDKYQYPVELVEIEKFGLAFQPYYIGIGNQEIIKTTDDPNAPEVVNIVNQNKNILIRNYNIYLEYINYEDRFNEKALNSYSLGLQEFFPKLITSSVMDSDFSEMTVKVDNMLKKSKNTLIIAQLQNIQNLLKNKATNSKN